MFDTLLINIEITGQELENIDKTYRCKKIEKKGVTIYTTRKLYFCGFDKITLFHVKPKPGLPFNRYYLNIGMTLSKVIHNKKYLGVATYQDLIDNEYVKKINDRIHKYLSIKYNLDQFKTKRADYAIDYWPEIYVTIDQLIYLAKRSKGLSRGDYEIYEKDGSYYLKNRTAKNPSIKFNCYDKYGKAMKDIANGRLDPKADVNQIKNKYRIEVQCLRPKIFGMMKFFKIKNRDPTKFLKPKIAMQIIKYYLLDTIGPGDYFSLNRAQEIINSSGTVFPNMKPKLIATLELIEKAGNMKEAEDTFLSEGMIIPAYDKVNPFKGTKNTYNSYIKKLRELGINPVTIPETWGVDHIKSPLHEVYKIEKSLGGPVQ